MLRVVEGPLPPSQHDEVATPTTFSQAKSRGLSTPAHLMISQTNTSPAETPLLDKRFSWEKSPTTPSASISAVPSTPSTPLSEFRQSLQKPLSPVAPRRIVHTSTPPGRMSRAWTGPTAGSTVVHHNHDEEDGHVEETPKKTKRWSDQLRGFKSSFAGLGGDDDWGSSLTSALNGDMGLQTVHESRPERRESSETEEPAIDGISSPAQPHDVQPLSSSLESGIEGMKISSTPRNSPPITKSPSTPTTPGSPSTPRDPRIRRKPVPLVSSNVPSSLQ